MYYVHGFRNVLAESLNKLNKQSSKSVAQTTVASRYCFLRSLEYGVFLKSKIGHLKLNLEVRVLSSVAFALAIVCNAFVHCD